MRAADIQVGGMYRAKVSGKLTVVVVEEIKRQTYGDRKTYYCVKNVRTGRQTTFRSAMKFCEQLSVDQMVHELEAALIPDKKPRREVAERPQPQNRTRITVSYPDGDGELWVDAEQHGSDVKFSFTYAARPASSPRDRLYQAALDIVAHFERQTAQPYPQK